MSTDNNGNDFCKNVIYSEDYLDLILDVSGSIQPEVQSKEQVCPQYVSPKFMVSHADRLGSLPSVTNLYYRTIPKLYGLMDTSSMESSGVLKLRRQPYLDLLGQGTLIAIIDTGVDYQNPLFLNADKTSRIAAIWDQTKKEGTPPDGLLYGSYYSQEDINKALAAENPLTIVPETDEDGHGTFLAGIAAGNVDQENEFTGVSPLSELIVVKLKPCKNYLREFYQIPKEPLAYQENDIMLAIKFVLNYSNRVKKPLSICIGLGTSSGDHNGSSPLSDYLDDISQMTGVTIATASGNEGNVGHHYKGTIAGNKFEDVELLIGEQDRGFVMELWASSPSVFSAEVISPSGETSGKIPARQTNSTIDVKFVLEPTKIEITYRTIEIGTGDELIFFRFTNAVKGIWKIRVYNDFNLESVYHIWLPISNFLSSKTYFLKPDPFTTLVDTGTTKQSTTVTYYNHLTSSIFAGASRGYNRNGFIKPDLAAPGVDVYGPIGRGKFGKKTGSSVAAAHVAGVNALLLQWSIVNGNRGTLDNLEAKTLLIKGANRSPNISYPNREWGYGTLDVYQTFESLRNTVSEQ